MEWIKVKKKPIEVEAFEITRDLFLGVQMMPEQITPCDQYLEVQTLEGTMRGNIGDWIIKGVKGEYYPCRKDIFKESYEEVKE